jgi:hypothetical protein
LHFACNASFKQQGVGWHCAVNSKKLTHLYIQHQALVDQLVIVVVYHKMGARFDPPALCNYFSNTSENRSDQIGGYSAKTGGRTVVWPVYRGSVARPVWCT